MRKILIYNFRPAIVNEKLGSGLVEQVGLLISSLIYLTFLYYFVRIF